MDKLPKQVLVPPPGQIPGKARFLWHCWGETLKRIELLSLLWREITAAQRCRRDSGAANPCLTWVLLLQGPSASCSPILGCLLGVLPGSRPLECLPPPTLEGEFGLAARAPSCCLGLMLASSECEVRLPSEVSLSSGPKSPCSDWCGGGPAVCTDWPHAAYKKRQRENKP